VSPTEPATPPRHARQEIIEAPASDGPDGLPRRVRQTSLAPQLRSEPADAVVADALPTPAAPERSPEQLRAMMTSFQSGMNRGRQAADIDASGENESGTPERDPQ
jgi:hypothetical protein